MVKKKRPQKHVLRQISKKRKKRKKRKQESIGHDSINLRLLKTFLIEPCVKFKTTPVMEIRIILHAYM